MFVFPSLNINTPPNTPVDKANHTDHGRLDFSHLNKSLSAIVNDKIMESKSRPSSTTSVHVMDPFNPYSDFEKRPDSRDLNSNYPSSPSQNPKYRSVSSKYVCLSSLRFDTYTHYLVRCRKSRKLARDCPSISSEVSS